MNTASFSPAESPSVIVNSRKYDGRIRRSWTGGLLSRSDELIVLVGRFEFDVEHNDLGHIAAGTVSFEHFWFDRWYNIFRFHEPDGALRAWYCNVAMPATFDGETLDFIDLDVDVVVWPDHTYEVLDLDDFEVHSEKFAYPPDIIKKAQQAVEDILQLVRSDSLPRAR